MAGSGDEQFIDEDLILLPQYNFTPIRALRMSSRKKIAQYLDLDGVLVVIDKLDVVNNYNGLSELIGFSYLDIRNIGLQKSPTMELLEQWTVKEQCENATVGNLWSFLFQMERFDVLKDCRSNILNDCRVFEDALQLERDAEQYRLATLEQDPKVSNSEMRVDETKVVTVADVRTGQMTMYDAFICYVIENEEDRKFVRRLIAELEGKRNLRLFVPGRDDLPGSAEHTITAYLIEKRCRRLIILMSNAFWGSQVCDFQTKFAHALAPGARSKKLIPVIREKGVPLPRILKFLAVCDFTKSDMVDWVWDRLETAIIAPVPKRGDPDYEDSESCSFDDLIGIPYPVTSSRRLDDDESSQSGEVGIDNDVTRSRRDSSDMDMSMSQEVVESVPRAASGGDEKKGKSKLPSFLRRKKDQDKKSKSEIVKRDVAYARTRDNRSDVAATSKQPVECVTDKHANTKVTYDKDRQSATIDREGIENDDFTHSPSSEPFTLSSSPYSTSPYGLQPRSGGQRSDLCDSGSYDSGSNEVSSSGQVFV
uniref:Myeloid differentiation factor 88 n=1 Tax=Tridacna crocea TaxID=80833 RepID=A0A6M3RHX5_TRICC|nr:myeloid differentiation factor 88 [Tridacna crocea]